MQKTDPIREMIAALYDQKIDETECQGCADKIRAIGAAKAAYLKEYDDKIGDCLKWRFFLSLLKTVEINESGDLVKMAIASFHTPPRNEYFGAQIILQSHIEQRMEIAKNENQKVSN